MGRANPRSAYGLTGPAHETTGANLQRPGRPPGHRHQSAREPRRAIGPREPSAGQCSFADPASPEDDPPRSDRGAGRPLPRSRDEVRLGHQAQVAGHRPPGARCGFHSEADHRAWSNQRVAAAQVAAARCRCGIQANHRFGRAEREDLRGSAGWGAVYPMHGIRGYVSGIRAPRGTRTNGACLPSGSRPETALRSDPGATTTVTASGGHRTSGCPQPNRSRPVGT
jgi:hypothetical protein